MKKIVSVLICLVMVLSLIPFTVSAADEVKFTLRIQEETEKTVTLTLDYDGGTGFSALDFEVSFDRVRLQLKSCKKGAGYDAFEKELNENGGGSLYSYNSNTNPLMFSIANIEPFRATDGEKDIVRMTFTKMPGIKFAKEDVTVEFTNCQTSEFKDIKVSFDYDMTVPASTAPQTSAENSTEYPQQPSSDNVEDNDSEIGDPLNSSDSSAADEENSPQPQQEDDGDNDSSKTKTVIIIVATVVVLVGIAAVVLFKVKKK